jgi:predicted nucleic acid-binding protein
MIEDLRTLPKVMVADTDEVLRFVARRKLSGSGIGYVDAHLLAAAALTPETFLWTRDKRLHAAAKILSLAAEIVE